jgi:RNA polymerase sigma-70 factor (ECF subfamily)
VAESSIFSRDFEANFADSPTKRGEKQSQMATQESTDQLIVRAKSGDREAFDRLADDHRNGLLSHIEKRLGGKVRLRLEAEDVLQETFITAFESVKRLRWQGEGSFFSWLCSIAEHLIWNASQKMSWSQLELQRDVADSNVPPSKNLRRQERFDRLEKAMRGLSLDQRTALTLARFEGLTIQDIAIRMNRSPNAVYKLIARALVQLKKDFGDTESLHLPQKALRVEEHGHEE